MAARKTTKQKTTTTNTEKAPFRPLRTTKTMKSQRKRSKQTTKKNGAGKRANTHTHAFRRLALSSCLLLLSKINRASLQRKKAKKTCGIAVFFSPFAERDVKSHFSLCTVRGFAFQFFIRHESPESLSPDISIHHQKIVRFLFTTILCVCVFTHLFFVRCFVGGHPQP